MKYIIQLLCIAVMLVSHSISAETQRKIFNGYIIKLNNDTVPSKISLPYFDIGKTVDRYRMCDLVYIEIEDGVNKRIRAEEIAGYSYNDNGTWYHYIARDLNTPLDSNVVIRKKTKKESDVRFLRRVTQGKATLYVYESVQDANTSNAQGNAYTNDSNGYGIGNIVLYFIEMDKLLIPIKESYFIKIMPEIVSDDPELVKKITEKEYVYKDLEKVVKEYNSRVF